MARKKSIWRQEVNPKMAYMLIGTAVLAVFFEVLILTLAVERAYAIAVDHMVRTPVPHYSEQELFR
ncbi:hypothetical protein A3D72_03595 [Candidatus Uhrbacteria bacterium RIFCSPHIGHO2_02_FULL_57_19]|uniref:Uncharacterized protein n=1 Tax=Candidatus Uhrbacteria bacterium RIFCSPHIGHO2_02_FULL_57_19 TaxID=1802391 RepID=A0A1F7U7J5_9BACT|nr:MAG: hypothetical protein A3D72_03595 [Candidatus Uhrbacteria bacterium RIFCSPHIGHO2_02_FULL_57_19]